MTTIPEAKKILSNNKVFGPAVFGPAEWKKYFGEFFKNLGQINTGKIPKIPWSQTELENTAIKQEHFLFLGLDSLGGMPLDMHAWHRYMHGEPLYPSVRFYSGEKHPMFSWYDEAQNATCQFRWYLMPDGTVKNSRNLSYEKQVALLPDEYEVPSTIERVTGNILCYLLNGGYLDEFYRARTTGQVSAGQPSYYEVYVYGYGTPEVHLCAAPSSADYAHFSIGVAASRKLP